MAHRRLRGDWQAGAAGGQGASRRPLLRTLHARLTSKEHSCSSVCSVTRCRMAGHTSLRADPGRTTPQAAASVRRADATAPSSTRRRSIAAMRGLPLQASQRTCRRAAGDPGWSCWAGAWCDTPGCRSASSCRAQRERARSVSKRAGAALGMMCSTSNRAGGTSGAGSSSGSRAGRVSSSCWGARATPSLRCSSLVVQLLQRRLVVALRYDQLGRRGARHGGRR